MPNYVSRMWLNGEKDGQLVAAMYGPSEVRHKLSDGRTITVTENTDYPFGNKIDFVFTMDRPARFPFTFRIPSWCDSVEMRINGVRAEAVPDQKGFTTLERRFKDGDVLTLVFDMPVEVKPWPEGTVCGSEDHIGSYVMRGPVLYSYAIPAEYSEDVNVYENMHGKVPGNPDFRCWSIRPVGKWNFAYTGL